MMPEALASEEWTVYDAIEFLGLSHESEVALRALRDDWALVSEYWDNLDWGVQEDIQRQLERP